MSVTSSSTTGAACGSRLAIRSTRDIRPYPVSTTVAPCSWASRAVWNAIDASVMTPVMSRFLPASSPVPSCSGHVGSVISSVGRTGCGGVGLGVG